MHSAQGTLRRGNRYAAVMVAFVCCLATGAASEERFDLFSAPGNFAILEPQPVGNATPPSYGPTGSRPTWSIAQWDIPGDRLPSFVRRVDGAVTTFSSRATESAVSIVREPGGTRIELSQDGATLPCLNGSAAPRESDLFIAPNSNPVVPDGAVAMTRRGAANPTLDRYASLVETATVSVMQARAKTDKGCVVNQADTTLALILNNAVASPPQTLFYQISLSLFCGAAPPQRRALCNSRAAAPVPFFTKNPFGISDFLYLMGQSPIRSGETRHLVLNLLPRLVAALAKGPEGIDRDPSHWVVGGVYAGQLIWGDVVMSSTWSNYGLVATLK